MIRLDELNPPQREAVTTVDGPLLVLAGAGSGKTRVITYRIAHLLERGVPPDADPRRLVHQQGRRRDARARRQARRRAPPSAARCRPSTRSACTILKRRSAALGLPSGFTIYDASDQLGIVARDPAPRLPERRRSPLRRQGDPVPHQPRQERLPRRPRSTPSSSPTRTTSTTSSPPTVYPEYQAALQVVPRARLRRPHLRDGAPARSRRRGARALGDALPLRDGRRVPGHQPRAVAPAHRIWCARTATSASSATTTSRSTAGAAPRPATSSSSTSTFPAPRSSSSRRTTARRRTSSTPPTPSSRTTRSATTSGCGPRKPAARQAAARRLRGRRGRGAASSPSEIEALCATRGFRPRDFAVLYRSNVQSRPIEEALRAQSLAYKMIGGQAFFERKEVKDAIAYLKLALQPRDEISPAPDHQLSGARHRPDDGRAHRRGRDGSTGCRCSTPARGRTSVAADALARSQSQRAVGVLRSRSSAAARSSPRRKAARIRAGSKKRRARTSTPPGVQDDVQARGADAAGRAEEAARTSKAS